MLLLIQLKQSEQIKMKSFKGLLVRKALNGCGIDYQDANGNWNVYFTSQLTNSESDALWALFK